MKLSNLTNVPQMVGIILKDGRKTSVRLMSKFRRIDLPPGATLDPRWVTLHPNTIAAFPTAEEIQAKEQQARKAAQAAAVQQQNSQ